MMFLYGSAALLLITVSGYLDGLGFFYASKVWTDNGIIYKYLFYALFTSVAGISIYQISVFFMIRVGIKHGEVHAILWFLVAMLVLTLHSKNVLSWTSDIVWAFFISIICLCWIIFRTQA